MQLVGYYSFFQNFYVLATVYSLPVISPTRTLVGWSDVRSLINTDGSIPALKTLQGKVFPDPSSRVGSGVQITPGMVKHSYWALWYGCPFAGIPIFRVEVAGGVT